MSIPVHCSCGKGFVAPPHLAGHQAVCPFCGQFAWVPAHAARRPSVLPWLVGGLVVVCLFVVCGGVAGVLLVRSVATAVQTAGAMPVQQEDYAVARSRFQTTLQRRGPSPQDSYPLTTPPGAVRVQYPSGDRQLTAFVDAPPPVGGRRPAVVFLHGGFAYGEEDWEMAQPFRDAGYLVMIPVLRGENGQPGDFTLFYDEVDDVLSAARELKKLPYVDTNNVFVAGHSAGGTLAVLSVLASDEFRAAAAYSGTMNQSIQFDPELVVYDRSDPRELQMRSPEAYAGSFKSPAQLYYGTQEYLLKDGNTRTAAAAAARGHNVQAMPVPGDHFSSVPPAMQRSIAFFNQQKDRRPPAPRGDIPAKSDPGATPATPAGGDVAENTPPRIPSRPFTPADDDPPPPADRPGPSLRPPSIPGPSLPQRPIPPGGAVVIFESVRYEGEGDAGSAARRALLRVAFVNPLTADYNAETEQLTFGVITRRGFSFDTGKAKEALESAGFSVGAVTFKAGSR
ncbi:MAG: prolyl oligopeptidase family serine peptidase [Pirellulaceae bacterium]